MIKPQKPWTPRLQSSVIKLPVNSSGTGLNIKILPRLTKFRTRSLRITTADPTSTLSSAAEESYGLPGCGLSVTSLVWRYFAINWLTWLWFIPIFLAITVCVWPASLIPIMRQRSLFCRVCCSMMSSYKIETFLHEGTPRKA